MNRLRATIVDITSVDSLHVITFTLGAEELKMMSLQLSDKAYLGARVELGVKALHVSLSKHKCLESSYVNQLPIMVQSCEHGELLSSIKFSVQESSLEAIILKECALTMNIKISDTLYAIINASELSIVEYIDE